VQFTEFGDSSLNFRLLVWIRYPIDAVGVRSDLRYQINQIFAEHDIEIPFPQRDLHLRSSEAILELADQRGWEVIDDLDNGSGTPSAGSREGEGDGAGTAGP
jgi:small-conductance mechanosensitive channel